MRNLIKHFAIIALVLSFSDLAAQTPLKVYQDTAALNNPGIQALYKQYEVVMQKVPQSSSLPDPTFGFGYFINSVETRVGPQQAVFSVSQSFPWFGKLGAQEQATTERALAVLAKYYEQRAKLNFDVAEAYNSLYVLRAAIRITDENLLLLNAFKGLANVRFESGKGSMVDVLRIEMELDELENQLQYFKDGVQPLNTKFEQLLNSEFGGEVKLPDVLWEDSPGLSREVIMDSVQILNPELRSLEHELLSYEQDVLAANKTGGPSFTVGLNYTVVGERSGYTGSDNGKDAILPTIGVKIPLYRKNYNALIQEKELARESVALKKIDKSNTLQTALENSFRDYDDAIRRIALYIKLAGYANQAMDLLLVEYSAASASFEDIISMDRKLLKYNLELEIARTDRNTAVAYINYLMGK